MSFKNLNVISVSFDQDAIIRRKEADRMEDARLIAEGIKTPQEIQERNSLIPPNAKIEVDFVGYLRETVERLEAEDRAREKRRNAKRAATNRVSRVS